jgi:glycosyltransferase involved in cell wall biosynthesis
MPNPISISAVIPTYNREQTIARAIDSILAQDYASSEIVVIDDGSSDNTRKVVERCGEKVRYVYQENKGVSAARNRCVSEARYEWIAFLDSDDYWLPHHLSRIANAIQSTQGEAALYFCDMQHPPQGGAYRHWDLCGFGINGPFEFKRDAGEWALMRTQPMMIISSVIRRGTYLEIGGLPESLITREDTLLFYKLCLLYPACAVPGCGAVMTLDAHASSRMTVVYDANTYYYWKSTILLYNELLRYSDKIKSDHRRLILERLVWSHLSISRLSLKKKTLLGTITNLREAFAINPTICTKIVIRMLRAYFTNRIRERRCYN